MRKSMPAKRYLLIAASLFVVVLSAKVTAWVFGSTYNFRTSASKVMTGFDINKNVYVPLGNTTVELENRFLYTDGKQIERQEQVYDMINLSAYRSWDNAFAKVFLRTELIDKPIVEIYPLGEFFPYYEKQYRQAGASGKVKLGALDAAMNARYRYFAYEPLYSFSDEITSENVRGDLEIAYEVYKPVSVIVNAYKKAALEKDYEDCDLSTVGTGLRLNMNLSPVEHLTGQTSVEWRKSDYLESLGSDRLIPIYHNLRYSRMFTPDIVGFLNYENRSYFGREEQQFLFNSHFLRGSVKYTLPYDLTLGSFVELGGKYAPNDELWHQSTGLLAKTEMKVIDNLYLGGGFQLMPERQNHYEALARYFFTPVSEVFVDYIYTDDPEYDDLAKYVAAGVRLMF